MTKESGFKSSPASLKFAETDIFFEIYYLGSLIFSKIKKFRGIDLYLFTWNRHCGMKMMMNPYEHFQNKYKCIYILEIFYNSWNWFTENGPKNWKNFRAKKLVNEINEINFTKFFLGYYFFSFSEKDFCANIKQIDFWYYTYNFTSFLAKIFRPIMNFFEFPYLGSLFWKTGDCNLHYPLWKWGRTPRGSKRGKRNLVHPRMWAPVRPRILNEPIAKYLRMMQAEMMRGCLSKIEIFCV